MTTIYLGSGIDLLICDNGAIELKQERSEVFPYSESKPRPAAIITLTPDKVCEMMDAIRASQDGYPTLEHSEDFVYRPEKESIGSLQARIFGAFVGDVLGVGR